ncbi:MAG TPA: muramoyltetrapeptide carboxypeptidase [Paucimonas sp.]|nr:muramoyltetrapeptide carboxypeptidase [Paucimonas sp.]
MADTDPRIPAGLGVAIVAPSGYATDEAAVVRGIARLQALGCRVKNHYDPAARYQRFGGTDEARVGQVHAAIGDPDVQLVIALRGGYGLSRILPMLDWHRIAGSGKLFVGASDFTAFQLALLKHTGAVSFSGPMMCGDFGLEETRDFTMRQFWECLTSGTHTIRAQAAGNPIVDVRGKLWGSNLAMLVHLIGTPYLPDIDGGILFVEDVGEHPYRIERMMLQLLHAGILQKQRAIVFGDMSDYKLTPYDNGYDFEAMVAYLRGRIGVPLLTGLPFGHTPDKATLAVGCDAHLVSDADVFELTMSGYPNLAGR